MDTIVVATGNSHKVQEIGEILGTRGYRVIGAQEMGGMPDVVEDGLTFQDNTLRLTLGWNNTASRRQATRKRRQHDDHHDQ